MQMATVFAFLYGTTLINLMDASGGIYNHYYVCDIKCAYQ